MDNVVMIGDTLLTWLKGKVEIVIKKIFVNAKKMNYCANDWLETCVFNARNAICSAEENRLVYKGDLEKEIKTIKGTNVVYLS